MTQRIDHHIRQRIPAVDNFRYSFDRYRYLLLADQRMDQRLVGRMVGRMVGKMVGKMVESMAESMVERMDFF
jgi:uncharacterized protein YbgA (DUF1722 family)